MGNHVHFSTFGKELTGIIVSGTNIEDILSDMDTGEGHFVYDSHGDIRENETLYIFAPKVDTHVIGGECKTLSHLPIAERCQLISERIERSYTRDSIILCIGKETTATKKEQWNPQKMSSTRKKGEEILENVRKVSNEGVRKIQAGFTDL